MSHAEDMALPGAQDLDIDVRGIVITSLVRMDTDDAHNVIFTFAGGQGYWWSNDDQAMVAVSEIKDGEYALTWQMKPGYEATFERMWERLSFWKDQGTPLGLTGAPGRRSLIWDLVTKRGLPLPRGVPDDPPPPGTCIVCAGKPDLGRSPEGQPYTRPPHDPANHLMNFVDVDGTWSEAILDHVPEGVYHDGQFHYWHDLINRMVDAGARVKWSWRAGAPERTWRVTGLGAVDGWIEAAAGIIHLLSWGAIVIHFDRPHHLETRAWVAAWVSDG